MKRPGLGARKNKREANVLVLQLCLLFMCMLAVGLPCTQCFRICLSWLADCMILFCKQKEQCLEQPLLFLAFLVCSGACSDRWPAESLALFKDMYKVHGVTPERFELEAAALQSGDNMFVKHEILLEKVELESAFFQAVVSTYIRGPVQHQS